MTKLVIFDLDDTLIHEGFDEKKPRLCAETQNVLDYLLEKGYTLAIASHNRRALEILKKIQLHEHFSVICGYVPDCVTKNPHIDEILGALPGVFSRTSIVLFDDLQSNVSAAKEHGIEARLVNWKTGVTLADVQGAGL